jgi:hypothetical protein
VNVPVKVPVPSALVKVPVTFEVMLPTDAAGAVVATVAAREPAAAEAALAAVVDRPTAAAVASVIAVTLRTRRWGIFMIILSS